MTAQSTRHHQEFMNSWHPPCTFTHGTVIYDTLHTQVLYQTILCSLIGYMVVRTGCIDCCCAALPTCAEYVLMGGQLLAPQTRAKWIIGSHLSNIVVSLYKCLNKENHQSEEIRDAYKILNTCTLNQRQQWYNNKCMTCYNDKTICIVYSRLGTWGHLWRRVSWTHPLVSCWPSAHRSQCRWGCTPDHQWCSSLRWRTVRTKQLGTIMTRVIILYCCSNVGYFS